MNLEDKELKEKRLAFLNETVEFYSKDSSRRASFGKRCEYITNDGRNCAIGRKMINPTKYAINNYDIRDLIKDRLITNKDFSEPILDLGNDFLIKIQKLHDDNDNWNHKGLTSQGKLFYNKMINIYCK